MYILTALAILPTPSLRPLQLSSPTTQIPMTTLIPREPYSKEELDRLYPKELKLELVQVVCIQPRR